MQARIPRLVIHVALVLAIVTLPLGGAALVGRPLRDFFIFPPPLRIPIDYLQFSWLAATAVLLALGALALWWSSSLRATRTHVSPSAIRASIEIRSFPGWGWLALGWVIGWWLIAWTRLPAFQLVQRYTFFPLWIGFIVTVNALTHRRKGHCGLSRDPRGFSRLFLFSALFWWIFEWLNRFVRNWHYLGVEEFGPIGYALHASLCFSTVLPAVAAVAEWLHSHPRWCDLCERGPCCRSLEDGKTVAILGIAGAAALLLPGASPNHAYPALWSAPIALLLATEALCHPSGTVSELARGDWRHAASWMVAALICGFVWELWNWHSLAKWIYTVPGVDRWHVFEMPLLGYSGYLPFGLECLLAARLLRHTSTAE